MFATVSCLVFCLKLCTGLLLTLTGIMIVPSGGFSHCFYLLFNFNECQPVKWKWNRMYFSKGREEAAL